jgi:ActR/RegA family two-component response regulator
MKHEAKIIMISAHDGEATNAIHNGADYFLAKPLSIDSIKKALEYVQFTN